MNCDACGNAPQGTRSQFWFLRGYFGITGCLCYYCYHKVVHGYYDTPRYPVAYRNVKKKLAARANALEVKP